MSKFQHYSPGATTLLGTKPANYAGRTGTRFYFADGRYLTVWDDGAIRMCSIGPDAPDWEVTFCGTGHAGPRPGSRRWEGGARVEDED